MLFLDIWKKTGRLFIRAYNNKKGQKMIKELLQNEIADYIGHIPNNQEYKKIMTYVEDVINMDATHRYEPNLSTVQKAILECIHEEFVKCAECGEYVLVDDVLRADDAAFICCDDCLVNYNRGKEWTREAKRELWSDWEKSRI